MMLAFGYVSASTQEKVKQGSNEKQKTEILRYAMAKGYEVEFFKDRAKPRNNTQRIEFERMLKYLDNKPNVIIVSKIDRFVRSLSDLLKTLEFLDETE